MTRLLWILLGLLGGTLTGFCEAGSKDESAVTFVEQLEGKVPHAISGNSAAVNVMPGTGRAGRLLGLPEKSGLRIGGVWLADANALVSGGTQPGKWSFNSALIVGANLDAEKSLGWRGASFGIQFLQFNGQDTNGQAGSVQGYNSLPGAEPLDRSELYQLWIRQAFVDDRIVFRIGKQVPTFDFNNVARPVSTHAKALQIPAVTGLMFTPVFVQPNLLGAIGGYYNSVYGISISVAPRKNTYLKYGLYDGNVARGVQTGMTGPHFNGYAFQIAEAGMDWILADEYPGNFGVGYWHQSGLLQGPDSISEDGTGGFYTFGSQRIWSNRAGKVPISDGTISGGKRTVGEDSKSSFPDSAQPASVSAFMQYGENNADTLPMNQSFGVGFTGFGLVPGRPADSIGVGMSWARLNSKLFERSSELMFQGYYQARVYDGIFLQPTVSYIPTPGASADLDDTWALTLRVMALF